MVAPAQRMIDALEMWEDGVAIKRASLRRRSPDATQAEIDEALDRWLAEPDLLDPDFVIVEWPRLIADAGAEHAARPDQATT
jgi:Rv0078B-related antitoxin